MPPRRLLIIGGSTRAAANSVRRAGWEPVCADLFTDYDLQMTAQTIPVRNYPDSLPEDVAHVRAEGWMYCGALENHPQILSRIAHSNPSLGPLLGTSPEALVPLRDPRWIAETMNAAGLPHLEIADQSSPPPPNGTWLQKPLASAGGRLIRVWDLLAMKTPFAEPHYFQRRAIGTELSALFRCDEGKCPKWLGATVGLSGTISSDAPSPFAYCGSLGPVTRLPEVVVNDITAIAETISLSVPGVNGLVGLDFILEEDRVCLVEINPRYTASVEVLELASDRSFLNPGQTTALSASVNETRSPFSPNGELRETLTEATTSPISRMVAAQTRIVAKQILYASRSIPAPDLREHFHSNDPWQIPTIADIPQFPSSIEAGWPICTVMSAGSDLISVQATLRSRSSLVQAAIGESAIAK